MTMLAIAGDALCATISTRGAELQTLRDADGRDLLWDGDPAFWTGRAPILFPVIGCVANGIVHVDGEAYPMPKHGFARHSEWEPVEQADDAVTLRLDATNATRASYPFDFRLDLRFAIDGAALAMRASLHNPGNAPLPASFGFHPALRWPLPSGQPRAAHLLRFEREEPAAVRRIDAHGLVRPRPEPSPVEGRDLHLRDALFEDDALIFDHLASRRLVYGAPGAATLAIDFPDMPQLGVWTKPDAGFICIEPWTGIADPACYAGELRDKPGIVSVPPGGTQVFAMRIGLGGRALG